MLRTNPMFYKSFAFLTFVVLTFSNFSYSLTITEVLYDFPYEASYCQYIELFNDTTNVVDLRTFKLSVSGYIVSITNIFLNDFECGGITNSFLLYPNQFAIVLPYSYAYSSKPFYFPTNVLVLTTSTKYLASFLPLKKEFLSYIKLISNDVVIDYVNEGNYSGMSIERTDNGFVSKYYPTLGYCGSTNLFFSKQIYQLNEEAEINMVITTNVNSLQVEVVGRGVITLNKFSDNIFRGRIGFSYNGERIIVKFGDIVATSRGVDLFEFSPLKGKVIINEICFNPTKRWFDYFNYGYSSGSPGEVDKYFEIISFSNDTLSLSNLFLHCVGDTEVIINVSDNAFYSSMRGILGDKIINVGEYILVSSPGISSNMAFMLRDGHPYKGGRLIDFVEEKRIFYIPFSHSNKFSYIGRSTVSLLPNALITDFGGKFLNWYESPSRYNGFSEPSLILDSKYKKVGEKIKIILVDEVGGEIIPIKFYSDGISRSLTLTNLGFYYYGEFVISTNYLDPFYVKENEQVVLEYYKNGDFFTNNFFVISEGAYSLNEFSKPILEKSILRLGEKIKFLNVHPGDSIILFDSNGVMVKEFKVLDNNFEIDSGFIVRRGVYFIKVNSGKDSIILKLFVF
ncbi:MAG: hypothetical protein ACP5QP_02980 [Brevinematia bacterium]